MDSNLKLAVADAMEQDFGWLDEPEVSMYKYTFSDIFEFKMKRIIQAAEYKYVSIGRHRLRRLAAMVLIAVMLMALAAGAVAVTRINITWNETQNDQTGMLDITFDVDYQTQGDYTFDPIKPKTPKGYRIVDEVMGNSYYEITYENKDGLVIYYTHWGNVAGTGLSLDNEDAIFGETTINGYKGYYYSKLGVNSLDWSDGIDLFDVTGTCDMSVLEEMAKSIQR